MAAMALYRLRIELPDAPGGLAHVAALLADSGASVISLDIHELAGPTAIDEIVIDAPLDWDADRFDARLAAAGAASLLSAEPASEAADPVVEALEWAIAIAAAEPEDYDAALGAAVLEVTSALAAWVTDVPGALGVEAGRLALERRSPVVVQTSEVPSTVAGQLPDTVWMLAVPDGQLDTEIVAFAVRPLTLHFSVSEIARVEQLVRLRRQLTRVTVA
ncbi:MAG TPA: ACT domain-containing protein [Acidimicrobiales bacterium]|nr:ACT domain-containing protein [Acidimicrobiales bacterium]